ncbi:MAG: protein kinase [Tepidisphaeraceae bacterium]
MTDLTITVSVKGSSDQEVFVQHGMSIGRNPSNTICIDEAGIERIHAQVLRQPDGRFVLECQGQSALLGVPDGAAVHSIILQPGTVFQVGTALLRCTRHDTRAIVITASNPWALRCPKCHQSLVEQSTKLKQCPACSAAIRFFRSSEAEKGKTNEPSSTAFEGWLPMKIDRYWIRAFVAQGGMGIVLRGLHEGDEMPAAVKLLRDDDPERASRFTAEIETLKSLRHPNVVRLQGSGTDGRLPWLAMDWVNGQPLSRLLSARKQTNSPFLADRIREILRQIAYGLEYLHQKGVIHRDLKPSNILVAHDGLVKLADFGIAKAERSAVTMLTQTGVVAGTESYASPEQLAGDRLGPASDVFSLGIVWYEMLMLRRPVGAFTAPHILRPNIPPEWSPLISRCLAEQASIRPSLGEILGVLDSRGANVPAPTIVVGATIPPPPMPALPPNATIQSLDSAEPPKQAPRLWSPNAASNWSLLFSPLFSSILIAMNYRQLGLKHKSNGALTWGIAIVAVGSGLNVFLQNPFLIWLLGLIIWYYGSAKPHVRFVSNNVGGNYIKRRWAKPLTLGFFILILVSSLTLVGELTGIPTNVQYGKDNIIYYHDATRADADALAKALKDAAYFGCTTDGETVLLDKKGDAITISFMVRPEKADDPATQKFFHDLAVTVAKPVSGTLTTVKLVDLDLLAALRKYNIANEKKSMDVGSIVAPTANAGDTGALSPADQMDQEAARSPADDLRVGMAYYDGTDGLPKNYKRAMLYFRNAAKANNTDAMNQIGCMYWDGLGVDQLYGLANGWFRQAAEGGNMYAMYNLGQAYEFGLGEARNNQQAIAWYRQAAALGDGDAKKRLAELGAQ